MQSFEAISSAFRLYYSCDLRASRQDVVLAKHHKPMWDTFKIEQVVSCGCNQPAFIELLLVPGGAVCPPGGQAHVWC